MIFCLLYSIRQSTVNHPPQLFDRNLEFLELLSHDKAAFVAGNSLGAVQGRCESNGVPSGAWRSAASVHMFSNRSANDAKKRAPPPHQQASKARFLNTKNSTSKRKTASSEAVPLPGDKSGDAGGVDRALSPRSTLVGQGGSDSPLGCHSLPPHSRPIALRTSNKKRSEFSDPSLLADKTNCTGGVDRARTYDLHDVNVAL